MKVYQVFASLFLLVRCGFSQINLTKIPNVQKKTGIVTMLGVGKARNRVSIPGTGEKISLFQSVQSGSGGPLSLLSNGRWG
jgi:hypothetical protein